MLFRSILEGHGDDRLVSDRLYLLHYLRNYADFLDLNAEAMAVEYVRETHRSMARPSSAGETQQRDQGDLPAGEIEHGVEAGMAAWTLLLRAEAEHRLAPAGLAAGFRRGLGLFLFFLLFFGLTFLLLKSKDLWQGCVVPLHLCVLYKLIEFVLI